MSGVVKGIGKVFKKVIKNLPKIITSAIAVAAIYFTAGAALGVVGMAGGWGGAVAGLNLGPVLGGAITSAGYGAAIGGVVSGVTGGDVMKGMQRGAATGAIAGGLTGAITGSGSALDPLAETGAGAPATEAAGADPSSLGSMPADVAPADTAVSSAATQGAPGSIMATNAPAPAPSGGGLLNQGSTPSTGPGVMDKGGWLERNQMLAGQVVGGLGQGIMGMGQADARVEAAETDRRAALDLDQQKADRIRANYAGTGRGLLTPENMGYIGQQPARPSPAQRFDPRAYGGRWQYDPQSGQVVFIPGRV